MTHAIPTSGFAYKYCQGLTRHYGKVFFLCMTIILAISTLCVVEYRFMVEQSEQTDYDWTVSSAVQSEQRDALEWARNERDDLDRRLRRFLKDEEDEKERERGDTKGTATIVYQHTQLDSVESIFTPENLQAMCQTENVLLGAEDYPNKCHDPEDHPIGYTTDKDDDGKKRRCAKPMLSVLSLYYLPWSPRSNQTSIYDKTSADYAFGAVSKADLGFMQLYTGTPVLYDVPSDAPTDDDDIWDGHVRKCKKLSGKYVKERTKQLVKLLDHSDDTRAILGFFLSKDVEDTETSEITRSQLVVQGSPLPGFKDEKDREDEQEDLHEALNRELEFIFWDFFNMTNTNMRSAYRTAASPINGSYPSVASIGDVDVRFMGPWSNFEFDRMVNSDLMWVFGSVTFVLFYISIHTFSLWLGSMAMFQIFTSLPLAYFFYRVIGQIDYFVQLHILTIFLVLGVGADDVFVYVDAWKQARVDPRLDTQLKRVVYTWGHTAQSVFNTSFTTASAFFATALNPVMPISSFGIFAALAVIMNYVLTITLFPTVVLLWENEWRWCWAKLCRGKFERVPWGLEDPNPAESQAQVSPRELYLKDSGDRRSTGSVKTTHQSSSDTADTIPVVPTGDSVGEGSTGSSHSNPKAAAPAPSGDGKSVPFAKPNEELRPFERFFREYYAPAINWAPEGHSRLKPLSIALILAFVGLGSAGVYFATQLQPPTEQEQWFTADHMFTGFEDLNSDRFLSGADDEYAEMSIVFGIKGISRDEFVRWKPGDNRGAAIFDEDFDITTSAAHKALKAICKRMREAPCDITACVGGFGKLVKPDSLYCLIEEFDDWFTDNWNTTVKGEYDGDKDRPTGDEFLDELKEFAKARGGDYETQSSFGFFDDELKYVEVPFTATMLGFQPYSVTLSYYDAVHEALNEIYEDLGKERTKLGSEPFVYAGRHFTWVVTEKSLVDGVLTGFAICFPVAFVVLVVATGSPTVSAFAILTIALIVSTTLGFCQAIMGWALGVAESISSTIVIGFSVDYVVHLGHAYRESAEMSREGKTSDALTQMGITVVAGAVTTLGSGLFMWACQMTFFTKMAVLICAVITLSIAYALLLFMPLCAVFGPEGEMKSFMGYVQHYQGLLKSRIHHGRTSSQEASTAAGPYANPVAPPAGAEAVPRATLP